MPVCICAALCFYTRQVGDRVSAGAALTFFCMAKNCACSRATVSCNSARTACSSFRLFSAWHASLSSSRICKVHMKVQSRCDLPQPDACAEKFSILGAHLQTKFLKICLTSNFLTEALQSPAGGPQTNVTQEGLQSALCTLQDEICSLI